MSFLSPISAVFVLFSATVSAQNIPDAGALMRQNEQSIRQDQMQRNALMRQSFLPEMQMSQTTRVTPNRIRFLGAKLLSQEVLQAVAKPYLDRALDAHELEQLTQVVSDAYRRAGWVVRVYIPQQDLTQNDLIVQILENTPSSAR
ncbi:POTRA domain-containing protein [Limnohabitans sp. TS-CS-82]|uniref:POTRA domain-containing protein n=1 Tax=Limnohabitans sp. TS-CS-82 TaxID=2094193 RepID=UPI0013750774|nr:POTRA domain-containing protein [Limnohabitans sp. TS-CS-82]